MASGSGTGDPFDELVGILCGIRADWEVKKRTLGEIAELIGAEPDSQLPRKVAESVINPEELRKMKEDSKRQHDEVDTLKAELFALLENATATKEMAEEMKKLAAEVKDVLGGPGAAVTKARLFEEEVHKDKKISGTRVVHILTDFEEQMEKLLSKARESADRIVESSQKLTEVPVRLSEISLPDLFPEDVAQEPGKDKTPQSSRAKKETPSTGHQPIDLDSPETEEEHPVLPTDGERNRNLNEVFEQLERPDESPTIGSRVYETE